MVKKAQKVPAICLAIVGIVSFLTVTIAAVDFWGYCAPLNQIVTYTESVGTVQTPAAGRATIWAPTFYPVNYFDPTKSNPTLPANMKGDLVALMINLAPFSAGQNFRSNPTGQGIDYQLDARFFRDLGQIFQQLKERGAMIAVRFRYDHDGNENPEPNSFDQVFAHIWQIKQSGLFPKYADVIAYVESGFVGQWGEQHHGKYTSLAEKVQLLKALLIAIPAPIPVTVRTPDIYAAWAEIPRADLPTAQVTKKDASRIGIFNDGYMGSDSDLGTFADRAKETTWLNSRTQTYYGGEFSGNWDWAQKFDTYLPANALPEMYQTHLSYINNANLFPYYESVPFDPAFTPNVDNSAYAGTTVFQFIRDHLGYRFVLSAARLPQFARRNRNMALELTLHNRGFANLIRSNSAHLIFCKGNQITRVPVNLDATQWLSAQTTTTQIKCRVPKNLTAGTYELYLQLTVGKFDPKNPAARSIQFANADVFHAPLGANRLGTLKID